MHYKNIYNWNPGMTKYAFVSSQTLQLYLPSKYAKYFIKCF